MHEPLSRQRRIERIESARQELRAFLSSVDPLISKRLTSPELLTFTEQAAYFDSAELQAQYAAAYREYIRLLIRLPDEWRKVRPEFPALAAVQERFHLGAVVQRGARRKPPDEREDTVIAQRVEQAVAHLRGGYELRERLRRGKGFQSGDEEIARELCAARYDKNAVAALIKARTLRSAAAYYVAYQTEKTPGSVKTSINRAARLPATTYPPTKNR